MKPEGQTFPVLMYHGIPEVPGDIPGNREEGAALYDVSLADFYDQMACLKDSGIVARARLNGTKPEDRAALVLTFDDGERNNYERAFPLLVRYGFSASFFVIADRIGKPGYMTPVQLKEMADAGMIIGSHGLTHTILTGLNAGELRRELEESKRILEEILDGPVTSFSVPRGYYDESVIQAARDAGYEEIYVSSLNDAGPDGIAPRVAVKKGWTRKRFQLALEGRTPAGEKIVAGGTAVLKRALGASGYNAMRGFLVRLSGAERPAGGKE